MTKALIALSSAVFAAASEAGAVDASFYDFSDTSDLSEELAGKLAVSAGEPPMVADIVSIVVNAPRRLSLTEVIAVATRMGLDVPAEVTVRNYLNRANADGRIVKPTRQTYAKPGTAIEEASDEDEVEAPADELADVAGDVLAGIE